MRPLTQIAEMIGAQDEAKQALLKAQKAAAVELRECVKEFLQTEATYAEDLRKVVDVFIEPLRSLLPSNLISAIFSNLTQLQQLHAGLNEDMKKGREKVATDFGLTCVENFAKLLPYFKMYSAYCCNYPHVAEALITAREEWGGVSDLIDEAEATRGVALQALLFRPVQRLCLYPLLLQKMTRSSTEGSPMREACEKAFAALQSLNSEVNETVRQMEARLRMTEVLMHVDGVDHLIEANRQLHLEALVDMKCPTSSALTSWGVRRSYKWYVLSDLLLICRPRRTGEGFNKKALWPLADLYVAPANGSIGLARHNSLSMSKADDTDTPRSSDDSSRTGSWNTSKGDDHGVAITPRGAPPRTPRASRAGGHNAAHGGKVDKPEVLRLGFEGVEYKCWASSEAEMLVLVERLSSLISESRALRRDLEKRVGPNL